jgi:predicted transposase/invertase (TIGR01784 family)
LREPIFTQAFATANLAAMDRRERDAYDASLKIYRDNVNVITSAKEKSRAEGRAEGIEQVAKKSKAAGIAPTLIAQITGLTASEIAAL